MSALSQHGIVLAFDRPAFGLTERVLKFEANANPYSLQAACAITMNLVDALISPQAQVTLVGHSMGILQLLLVLAYDIIGCTVSVAVYGQFPTRVQAIVLEAPAIFSGGPPPFAISLMSTFSTLSAWFIGVTFGTFAPSMVKSAYFDEKKYTPEMAQLYNKPLQVDNWNYALIELTKAVGSSYHTVQNLCKDVDIPVLIIKASHDKIVKAEEVMRASKELQKAKLIEMKSMLRIVQLIFFIRCWSQCARGISDRIFATCA